MVQKRIPPSDRFWKFVVRCDGCWEWQGARSPQGYGFFKLPDPRPSGRQVYAHRFSWEQRNGLIPVGLLVCHRCDNPTCVNPEHLFLGTYKDNMQDALKKGRLQHMYGDNNWVRRNPERLHRGTRADTTNYLRGVQHPNTKFSEDDAKDIRSAYQEGTPMTTFLVQWGVSKTTLFRILRSEGRWQHFGPSIVKGICRLTS